MIIKGFKYSAVAAGIRKKDRLDVGLIYSENPAVAAGVFTTNRVKAAPVLLDMERIGQGRAQAILVNSGVANACTGEIGMQEALACSGLVAAGLLLGVQFTRTILVEKSDSLPEPPAKKVSAQPQEPRPGDHSKYHIGRSEGPSGLYLDLMKHSLTDLIYEDSAVARRRR